MRNKLNALLVGLFLAGLGLATVNYNTVYAEETRKKLQTGVLKIFDDVDINDSNDTASGSAGVSSVIDLSGAELDACDFQVSVTSGACDTCTLDFAVQTSADGGTTYAQVGTFTQITSSSTATEAVKQGLSVAPGTKARVVATLSSATTFYSIDMWGVCIAD